MMGSCWNWWHRASGSIFSGLRQWFLSLRTSLGRHCSPQRWIQGIETLEYKGNTLFSFSTLWILPLCVPTEILAFNDRIKEFRALNTEVVACSVEPHSSSSLDEHTQGWRRSWQIRYPSSLDFHPIPFQRTTECTLRITATPSCFLQHLMAREPCARSWMIYLLVVVWMRPCAWSGSFQYTDKHREVCPAGWKPRGRHHYTWPNRENEVLRLMVTSLNQTRPCKRSLWPFDGHWLLYHYMIAVYAYI